MTGKPTVVTLGCEEARAALEGEGLATRSAADPAQALAALHEARARALLVHAERARAPTLVADSRQHAPFTEVFVWAPGGASPDLVRDALRSGAEDVVLDPDPAVLASSVAAAIASQQLLPRLHDLRQARSARSSFEGLVTRSDRMWELFETCVRIASTEASVLILGETGTGKELIARAIHAHSGREGRFVAINCGGIPEALVDSELFGYEKGTFTGAHTSKEGLVRGAHGGTLFLDEIGNMPLSAQFSLLRSLQEGTVRPVGGAEELPVDVRVIAATSAPLDEAVRRGSFREDLLYRLDVIRLVIPPLRERVEDVVFLFGHFRKKLATHYRVELPEVSDEFVDAMLAYPWPGNVRELENLTERLVLTYTGAPLGAADFSSLTQDYGGRVGELTAPAPAPAGEPPPAEPPPRVEVGALPEPDLARSLAANVDPLALELERRYLEAALAATRGRIDETADLAGLSPRTLLRKLRRHGIDKRAFKRARRR